MIVFPNCKINLGLQVLRKRNDGYHDLETVFYPIPLTDALEIIEIGSHERSATLVRSVAKSLKEHGDKLEAAEKEKIESALKDAEGVLKSEDKDKIEAQSQALAQAAQKLGEKIYADSQAQQQAGAGATQQQQAGGEAKKDDGDVVDAEFTEVKDKKDGTGR